MAASFSGVRVRRFTRRGAFHLIQVLLFCAVLVGDVSASAQHPEGVAIRGVVEDADGNPAAATVVRLQHAGAVTRTDAHGGFAFENVRPGRYVVYAEDGYLSASREVSTDDSAGRVVLILAARDANAKQMDFADSPNFKVAGITDWTAVGGHGSDASLRASETLARQAAMLKPAMPGPAAASARESELRAAAAASPGSFAANRELGRFCLQKRSYGEALVPLLTAFRIDPTNRSNEYDLALAYKETGDLKRSQEHVLHLLAEENAAEFHRLAGDLNEAMGDALSAEREYETAVHLEPSEANEFTWGTELLLHRAVWPAIEVFKRGVATHPKSMRMLSALGIALFSSAQYEEAAQYLCRATELAPQDPVPNMFLGEIVIVSPAPLGCAEQELAQFVQTQSGNAQAKYYYAMAILKRQETSPDTADVEKARSLLMEASRLDPKLAEADLQLGILSMNRKDYQQAISYFTKAVEADSRLGDAHYRMGVAYQRIGSAAQAQKEFEQHDAIVKAQAQTIDQQRARVKQFMVVLQGQSSAGK
jgi:tetratricopeptide (TPR) repeat protein